MSTTPPTQSALAPLDQATSWLNSDPLTAHGLLGRTVAVDFCTYSCVNWLRTLPYRRAWHERYSPDGLVVVGAHAPEFGFEHDLGNVRHAIAELGVPYPVVIDNDFAIWQAFANRYWPALYLVDGDGRLRFHHFGEGAYDTIERAIQQQLGVEAELSQVDAGGVAAAADWDAVRSPETYLGSARGDTPRSDAHADRLELNQWTLVGEWTQGHEAAVVGAAGGSLAFRFHARDLNLVLAPPSPGTPVGFTVRLDGRPPGDAHGLDVGEDGSGLISEPRMYQLIRQHGGISERTFEVTFRAPGATVYVFTFG
jgi:hypothetical protein